MPETTHQEETVFNQVLTLPSSKHKHLDAQHPRVSLHFSIPKPMLSVPGGKGKPFWHLSRAIHYVSCQNKGWRPLLERMLFSVSALSGPRWTSGHLRGGFSSTSLGRTNTHADLTLKSYFFCVTEHKEIYFFLSIRGKPRKGYRNSKASSKQKKKIFNTECCKH